MARNTGLQIFASEVNVHLLESGHQIASADDSTLKIVGNVKRETELKNDKKNVQNDLKLYH